MRISGNVNIETITINKTLGSALDAESTKTQGRDTINSSKYNVDSAISLDNNEESRKKVQEAVTKMNEMLEVNNSTSKFVYHEGLERYYVTVVDRATDEVVKEIPAKKLLDAFYEMQKMLGMIVDEKI